VTDARVQIVADGDDATGETVAEPDGDVTFQWILGRT